MALSFAEVIPIAFYSLFAFIIITILVRIKAHAVPLYDSKGYAEDDMYQVVLYCAEDVKFPRRVYLCSDSSNACSPDKQRDQQRYHGQNQTSERKNTARNRSSPLAEDRSPLISSGNTSSESVYHSDLSRRESQIYNANDSSSGSPQYFENTSYNRHGRAMLRKKVRFSNQYRQNDPAKLTGRPFCHAPVQSGEKQTKLLASKVLKHKNPHDDVARNMRTSRTNFHEKACTLGEREVRRSCDEKQEKAEVKTTPSNVVKAPGCFPSCAALNGECANTVRKLATSSPPKKARPIGQPAQSPTAAGNAAKPTSNTLDSGVKLDGLEMVVKEISKKRTPPLTSLKTEGTEALQHAGDPGVSHIEEQQQEQCASAQKDGEKPVL
ncbi:hypothetical protein EGW08_010901 [Elysia chlorotica]|uniref:Uncharacterized protein n=1 Tax=Elysia chlorotica TaxID=188477 RepID=A0A433TIE2_ELYCH|nr:hypothetical protein EGW08_010901 [Elysia chlorotica]